jgi:hypothetical protein
MWIKVLIFLRLEGVIFMRELKENELRSIEGGLVWATIGITWAAYNVAEGVYREYLEQKHDVDLDGDGNIGGTE